MAFTLGTFEEQQIWWVAHQYRRDGYEVIIQPSLSELPDFLEEYKPELIAKKNGENAVIDVRTRYTLNQINLSLVKTIEEHPDWHFHLVVNNPPPPPEPEYNYPSLELAAILDQLTRANQQADQGNYDTALLLLCSAAEAVMRLIGEKEESDVKNVLDNGLTGKMVYLGYLYREEYELLKEVFYFRDAIAHGYQVTTLNADLVNKIMEIVRRLVGEVSGDSEQ